MEHFDFISVTFLSSTKALSRPVNDVMSWPVNCFPANTHSNNAIRNRHPVSSTGTDEISSKMKRKHARRKVAEVFPSSPQTALLNKVSIIRVSRAAHGDIYRNNSALTRRTDRHRLQFKLIRLEKIQQVHSGCERGYERCVELS